MNQCKYLIIFQRRTLKSKGKRSEEGDKDTPTDGSNYLNDDSSDSVSHESKGKNKKRDEESHKETSVSEGASMIEFDPKKVFNKDTFIHCKTMVKGIIEGVVPDIGTKVKEAVVETVESLPS